MSVLFARFPDVMPLWGMCRSDEKEGKRMSAETTELEEAVRERNAAEATLARIAVHCRIRLDMAIVQGPVSDLCRDILAIIGDDIPEAPAGTFDNSWSDDPPIVLQPSAEMREAVARAMTPDPARSVGRQRAAELLVSADNPDWLGIG